MTSIYLLRHGEAAYELEKSPGEFPGVPLNDMGRVQSIAAASALKDVPFTVVFCSDMRRTKETIMHLLPSLQVPVHYDARLRELGDERQVAPRLDAFAELLSAGQGAILVVSHFNVIRYLSRRLGAPVQSPACGTWYMIEIP